MVVAEREKHVFAPLNKLFFNQRCVVEGFFLVWGASQTLFFKCVTLRTQTKHAYKVYSKRDKPWSTRFVLGLGAQRKRSVGHYKKKLTTISSMVSHFPATSRFICCQFLELEYLYIVCMDVYRQRWPTKRHSDTFKLDRRRKVCYKIKKISVSTASLVKLDILGSSSRHILK